MFSLLAWNVLSILDCNMQQLTLQTNAPLLKSAWHESASLRDGMGCFEGRSWFFVLHSPLETSASGIIWSKEIGQWNDLTLKEIGNDKLDARNVQGPPTQCVTIRSNSSWPKRIETWRLLVLQNWTRKILSRFKPTAQRPWSMQMAFWSYRHDPSVCTLIHYKFHWQEFEKYFDHACFGHPSQVWNSWFNFGQISISGSNAILLNVPPAWNSKE